ncbi:TetR/AcrR family transcriptional regulator [Dietzia sp. CQ4]|uniref:TetR/AcrR family transcriptional regulator n=1 Tax=Dietzia sp. (strain CQ4) TaxID=370437 RepID=UPI0015F99999|nr:TetR/AcrR family transcriptional regulator [Dietzia sp. CQ4]MBB1034080.1 TetR/AcrR family transcriptional regulator [Dietzia sp. CQ4]
MAQDISEGPRRRMSREERHAQLVATARAFIQEFGTDELTLGRLAAEAGVTKPVVYDHFGDRSGVFVELYEEFEARQRSTLSASLRDRADDLERVCTLVAEAYVDCWLAEGREMAGVVAALAGSPALERLRHDAERGYIAVCQEALEPIVGTVDPARMQAVIGAGDALARDVLSGALEADRARHVLTAVVLAMATEPVADREERRS